MNRPTTYCCEFLVLKHRNCSFSPGRSPHGRSVAIQFFSISCLLHSCNFFILIFLTMAVPGGRINAQGAGMVSQTMGMEFKFHSLFDLQLLPEKTTIRPPGKNSGSHEAPVHWIEITGDENVEMIVHVHQEKDSVRAFYINSGAFDASRAVPFPDSQTAFVLNSAPRNSAPANFFKAWIGIRANEKCRMTFEYP